MLATKVLPTTYNTEKNENDGLSQKKNAAISKKITTLLSLYSIFAGQRLFFLTLNLCDLPRRGGDYPYSRIAHIVQQRVKLPPLGILPGGLLHKELIYGYVIAQHKLKEYL